MSFGTGIGVLVGGVNRVDVAVIAVVAAVTPGVDIAPKEDVMPEGETTSVASFVGLGPEPTLQARVATRSDAIADVTQRLNDAKVYLFGELAEFMNLREIISKR